METMYLSLDASYVTVMAGEEEQQASGGAVCYTRVSRREPSPCRGGRIVDLADYRPAEFSSQELEAVENQPEEVPMARRQRWAMAADLCAALAVIAGMAGIVLAFFGGL